MRGLDNIAALRRAGLKPDGFVTFWTADAGARHGYAGRVIAEKKDRPAESDLRALVGLPVIVVGRGLGGFNEAEAWGRALARAGAASVGLSFAVGPEIDGPAWIRWNGEDLA